MNGRRWPLLPLAVALTTALALPQGAGADVTLPPDTPVSDPIPDDPTPSKLGLVLQEFASFPKSEPVPTPTDARLRRHARINHLGELPDGSGRLYVPDLNGDLYFLPEAGGTPSTYLDVKAAVGADFFSGRGLGSGFGFVTFSPEFGTDGKFYTVHSEAGAALDKQVDFRNQSPRFVQSVITEWTARDPAASTFSGTSRELLRIGFASQIHAVQQIDFNPNAEPGDEDYGLLYVAVGDGGVGVTQPWPQDMAVPHGKILRIDPDGRDSANGKYGVPASNPFVGTDGALGEIYAVGMRDPHRFTWDTRAGERMFLGHIGEHGIEGVYDVDAGDDFGWGEREGAFVFKPSDRCNLYTLPADDAKNGYDYPVAAFDHDPPTGWSCTADSGHGMSGGHVYRGSDAPQLKGHYVFGDLVDGRVFATRVSEMDDSGNDLAEVMEMPTFDTSGNRLSMQQFAGDARVDLRFGRDAEGELYFLSKANGTIWKVVGTKQGPANPLVHPSIEQDLVSYYDFDHPFPARTSLEVDQGRSDTYLSLVNGEAAMRVPDGGAHPGSGNALQTKQVGTDVVGNDDWKAGIYNAGPNGAPTLEAFNAVEGTTVMGWFKMTGTNPNLNTNTADPADLYNAVGLAGILSGNSDGHGVRSLLEIINVGGELKLVALGRRLDTGSSQTFAATRDWRALLPQDRWVHLAATFDYTNGTMALYRNGQRLEGTYTTAGDPWAVAGPGPHATSATTPRGYKIGGSYPQDTREQNPCNCQMDGLMFLDRSVEPDEVKRQYLRMLKYDE